MAMTYNGPTGVNTPIVVPGTFKSRQTGLYTGGGNAGEGKAPPSSMVSSVPSGGTPTPNKPAAPNKNNQVVAGKPGSLGTGMPLDESAQIALQQAALARAAYMHQLRLQGITTGQEYSNEMQDLNTQHPIDESTLNSNYGSRGLGFSSGSNNANQQLQTVYGTNVARLDQAHQDALQQLLTDRSDYQNSYLANQAAIREAAADRLSAVAGSLGLHKPVKNVQELINLLNGRK